MKSVVLGAVAVGLTILPMDGYWAAQASQESDDGPSTGASPNGTGHDASALAKKTQNPGAVLVSVPLQFNFNANIGQHDRSQLLLNIQPILPVPLTQMYALITRWILPVLAQPDATSAIGSTWGIGDFNPLS